MKLTNYNAGMYANEVKSVKKQELNGNPDNTPYKDKSSNSNNTCDIGQKDPSNKPYVPKAAPKGDGVDKAMWKAGIGKQPEF